MVAIPASAAGEATACGTPAEIIIAVIGHLYIVQVKGCQAAAGQKLRIMSAPAMLLAAICWNSPAAVIAALQGFCSTCGGNPGQDGIAGKTAGQENADGVESAVAEALWGKNADHQPNAPNGSNGDASAIGGEDRSSSA